MQCRVTRRQEEEEKEIKEAKDLKTERVKQGFGWEEMNPKMGAETKSE